MMYYVINKNFEEEVGFFKSDLDMRAGGSLFAKLTEDFIIVGYSVDDIEVNGFHVDDLGIINDDSVFFSAEKWREDGWAVIKPVEVFDAGELAKLISATVNAQLAEYIGGGVKEDDDTGGLSMVPDVDEDEMPF